MGEFTIFLAKPYFKLYNRSMKVIMIMFDSLNRHFLPNYGNSWVHAPNFKRLGERTVTFTSSFVGSMPCMPARREIHTGRYNFLHRSWGPLEPFDDSMPELLKKNNIHSHLVTDHYHYFEDGGSTYHSRYKTWEMVRGQELDTWKGLVKEKPVISRMGGHSKAGLALNLLNREQMKAEKDHYVARTFKLGLDFIKTNCKEDSWFLHLENFSPHEPFFTPEKYKKFYPHKYNGPAFDWPPYSGVKETREQVQHCRYEYAALVSMCDEYLGRVLDLMDKLDLWKDTMLIVNTDHGLLLGEHGWWAKNFMPFYNEIANTPLFIWDPRSGKKGIENDRLVQTIDLAPTVLDFFKLKIPKDMLGKPLKDTLAKNVKVREAGLFGILAGQMNCTDGRYVYMKASKELNNWPLYQYTLMPAHMRSMFSIDELKTAKLAKPFSFTKGLKTLKIELPKAQRINKRIRETLLFDLKNDPGQKYPIKNKKIEKMMTAHMVKLLKENDAPKEQYRRLGLKAR